MTKNILLTDAQKVESAFQSIYHYLPTIMLIACIIFITYLICRLLLRIWDWRQILQQKYVLIEITPPITANKTPLQSTKWLAKLHSIGSSRTPQDSLRRLQFSLSLELPSTRREGIRYYIRVPEEEADLTKQAIAGYLNKARIRIVDDYLPTDLSYKTAQVLDFKLTGAYYLPLGIQESFKDHDPVSHLTNAMVGLSDDEQIVLQLILRPANISDKQIVRQRLMQNDNMLAQPKQQRRGLVFKLTIGLVLKVLSEVLAFIGDIFFGTQTAHSPAANKMMHDYQVSAGFKPARSITPHEQDVNNSIRDKVAQDLFRVEVRTLVITSNRKQAKLKVKAMKAAMLAYKTEHQGLRAQWNFPSFILNRYRLFKFTHRLPSLYQHHSNKLAPSELADIYHFPSPDNVAENLVQSLSRTLPATLSQKRGADIDIIVGRNIYQEQHTDIGLTEEIRRKHMYLIGSTGTGKTTLLKSCIYQDMVNGKGLAMLDPHGDMFRELLAIVPEHRQKDVVVFDPSDRKYPFGLNMLSPGIHFANEEDGHSAIKSSVISVFSKLTDKAFWGPRMEHILECATLTALQLPNPSLYTLQKLLTDKRYMREALKIIKDPILKEFWLTEMLPLGDAQLATTVAPLTHRVGKFIVDPMSRNILLQQESTLRLSEIMDEGKILLVNLSKGDVGEDKSRFFGTILTSLIWMSAYQRTHIDEKKRRDFYLYIDEFQNFAAPGFADITSEGRKFHVPLIASHQNIAQIEDQNLLKIIAGNSHTIICLRASPSDEAFILPYMEPAVEKGNIVNLAPHHFFMKTVTDESELAFSGVTVPLEQSESEKVAKDVIAASRKRYGTPRKVVESYLDTLFSGKKPPKESPPDDTKSANTKDEP